MVEKNLFKNNQESQMKAQQTSEAQRVHFRIASDGIEAYHYVTIVRAEGS
jgi:hypothetical protein